MMGLDENEEIDWRPNQMTTVAENEVLHEALTKLTLGSLRQLKGLGVVPLFRFDAADPGWLTSDEAMAAGVLEVTEVSEGGSVPTLRVVNKGDRAVFLLDSEELVGAKQNRILNTSVLIAAGQTILIPVSCVEQGRWGYRSRAFTSTKRSLYASVRRKKAAQVYASLRSTRRHEADQSQIWADLEAKASEHGVQSPTFAMSDVFESRDKDLEAYRRAFPPEPGQVGAIVYIGSQWWALDLLPGSPADVTDLRDAVVADGKIGDDRRAAAPVIDRPVADDDVVVRTGAQEEHREEEFAHDGK